MGKQKQIEKKMVCFLFKFVLSLLSITDRKLYYMRKVRVIDFDLFTANSTHLQVSVNVLRFFFFFNKEILGMEEIGGLVIMISLIIIMM